MRGVAIRERNNVDALKPRSQYDTIFVRVFSYELVFAPYVTMDCYTHIDNNMVHDDSYVVRRFCQRCWPDIDTSTARCCRRMVHLYTGYSNTRRDLSIISTSHNTLHDSGSYLHPTRGCSTPKVFRTLPRLDIQWGGVSKHMHPVDLGIIMDCKCNPAIVRHTGIQPKRLYVSSNFYIIG